MKYEIPDSEVENFISVYWQLLRTVEQECCEGDMLNQILVEGAYRLLNRSGITDARPAG